MIALVPPGLLRLFKLKLNIFSFILLILLISVAPGCNSKDSDHSITDSSSVTGNYDLPKPEKISAAEKSRISNEADTWFNTYLANSSFNGSLLIAKGGAVVYEKYKGSIPDGSAVNEHTQFHIASVSKTFTAMSVLKLQEEGKLNINDTLTKYFPGFNYPGVTVKTLLDHRSGLPNYLYFMEKLWPDKNDFVTNKDILDYLINRKDELPPAVAADTRFSYCNTNYALLALIIEQVSGVSYPEFIQKTIFDANGMKDSYVFTPGDKATVLPSYYYRGQEIAYSFLDNVYGDKNIYSTTHDLLRWDRLLKSGLFLPAESLQMAYAPYSNEKPGIKNYGLGWRMNIYDNGKKIVFHNGWWHGNTAAFIRLFDEDVTIIALNNHLSQLAYKSKLLSNIFFPYYPVDTPEEE